MRGQLPKRRAALVAPAGVYQIACVPTNRLTPHAPNGSASASGRVAIQFCTSSADVLSSMSSSKTACEIFRDVIVDSATRCASTRLNVLSIIRLVHGPIARACASAVPTRAQVRERHTRHSSAGLGSSHRGVHTYAAVRPRVDGWAVLRREACAPYYSGSALVSSGRGDYQGRRSSWDHSRARKEPSRSVVARGRPIKPARRRSPIARPRRPGVDTQTTRAVLHPQPPQPTLATLP